MSQLTQPTQATKMRKRRAPVRAPAGKRARRNGRFRGRRANGPTGELKFHDLNIDDASVTQNGTIVEDSVLTIAQGTTESERIGRKVVVKTINWRWNLLLSVASNSANVDETVRLILYQDKQTNGAAAAITDILETDDYQAFNQLANKSRFRTLMDRLYTMNAQVGAGNGTTNTFGNLQVNDSVFLNVNIPIEYDNSATTGAISTMRSNNIGVLILSKDGALVVMDGKMRVRFSDG